MTSRLPDHWSLHHDARLRETNGRYAQIEALSREWQIASTVLIARWHRIRGR